jgi:hypothetical protein
MYSSTRCSWRVIGGVMFRNGPAESRCRRMTLANAGSVTRRSHRRRPNRFLQLALRHALRHFASPDERRRAAFAARVCLVMLRLRHHADVDARGVAFRPLAEDRVPPFDWPGRGEGLSVTSSRAPITSAAHVLGFVAAIAALESDREVPEATNASQWCNRNPTLSIENDEQEAVAGRCATQGAERQRTRSPGRQGLPLAPVE